MTTHRHICVHGHFYQPPRENPWLGEIEREESATPFHDWNERIAEECYGPMAMAIRAGSDGRAISFDNVLSRMAFDFGPTLLSWLERRRPSLYRKVILADQMTAGPEGLGAAIAHPYFHAILPLANARDKRTLIRWGLADFKARFGRDARGFWLPETAVDDETLDLLAREGVEFTVLDPSQAAFTKGPADADWREAAADALDPKLPYRWTSPFDESRRLAVFFYHRRLSKGVVSGETVADATRFMQGVLARLMPGDAAQLVHVASDGEFYGHHHPGAERTLGLALDLLAREQVDAITHARFLRLFPPPFEVRIKPRTAWSCEHGLGRWLLNCGCRSAHLPDWTQDWRGPLREALDKLARRLDVFYEDEAARFFADPWAVRDDASALWIDPREAAVDRFLDERASRPLLKEDRARVLRLLVMQRERLAMFTSCGWFFDDVSGVEAVQVLQRAARALDLAKSLGEDAEAAFTERLAAARSNLRGFGDGAGVYRKLVAPTRVTLERAAAHAAILEHCGAWPLPMPAALEAELQPSFSADKMSAGSRRPSFSQRVVRVSRPETRETGEWNVLVHRSDRLDFACWVVPAGRGDVDSLALGKEFISSDDAAFRASLDSRFGAAAFGLDAVFSDERSELVKTLIPASSLGPERAEFMGRWTRCVLAARQGAREDDALLELLGACRERGFVPADLPWSSLLEELMHVRLERALDGGAENVSRALRWIDALWSLGLVTGAWRLREFQRRWQGKLAGSDRGAEKDACRALGEKLGLADPLLA